MAPEHCPDRQTVLNEEGQSHFVFDRRIDHPQRIGNRLAIASDAGAFLISQLEISELEQKLAVRVRRVCLDDDRLPARWPAIGCVATQSDASFRILPDRTRRLNHQTGIETSLLVSRWSKVIVGENGPERTI